MPGIIAAEKTLLPRLFSIATFLSILAMAAMAQSPDSGKDSHGVAMTHAVGSFTVKLDPQKDQPADPKLSRMTIDKQFTGDLQASSHGQMFSAGTDVKGSAGYVAIEKVTGTLSGRSGSFVLQHSATMNRGVAQLSITVVPDSGTGELVGIHGSMRILIKDGAHSYDFEYAIEPHGVGAPPAP
jgi:predicted flavoprotein YhiN